MILCNGIEKSGLHALAKSVELLGFPGGQFSPDDPDSVWQGHFQYGALNPKFDRHIYIRRHPRNMLVSWLRWNSMPVTSGTLIGAMQGFVKGSLFDYCSAFLPWLNRKGVYQVEFDSLIGDGGATLQGVAEFLGVPLPPDAYANIPGFTQTWSGQLSDWNLVWTSDIDAAWIKYRCNEIQVALGY